MKSRLVAVIERFVNPGDNYRHHHVGSWVAPNDSTNIVVLNIFPLGDPSAGLGTCSRGRKDEWNFIDCTTYTSWI